MSQITRQQAAERVMARADALAAISETPNALTRVYLSTQHLQANQLVGQWMSQAGMTVWQDSVGNICGRYEGEQEGAPAVLLGSHLDTVRNAGRYDGMLGVLTAIEVVDSLHQQEKRLAQAIEIVGFCDEEGTRFGITLLGSRGLTGTWPESWLDKCDANGVCVAQAMVLAGLDPARVPLAARNKDDFSAYLELHIEQGPCLEQQRLALGVVEAINGARRLNCRFTGEAGHAGTVPMAHRKDALAASAEWMVMIESTTLQHGGNLVATVGELRCLPGAVNVIPGEVALSLDIRGPQDAPLDVLLNTLLAQAQTIATRRGLSFSAEEFYRIAATPCDAHLQTRLGEAVAAVQGCTVSLPSGAGHDAIAMAERWPVGMLFVRCKGGVSHHPAESVMAEDVAQAIDAFTRAVTSLT
ncbi:allantoate amidohydrolase [Enterobacter sp. RHBSTW-00901]|uniref:allantoate amidohydrolase n=1 Tax=Enterobacter sp. RHBSTW-00901 TaxID=2742669 RepID=UPI0015F7599A|nr:allantoate amidohydrolase [Enterobacter sp. RHBSTW-00901]MBA7857646.1 allantoate amidohydrolase [Enterobacter sp. RHBSTW-00901]